MKFIKIVILLIVVNISCAQQQYVKDFTPVIKDFSDFGYSIYGPSNNATDNSGPPRSCTFYNGLVITPAQTFYSNNYSYDPFASTHAPYWDSLVFKFKYNTSGYAKNFNIKCEFLVNSGTNFPYNLTKTFTTNDSAKIRFKYTFYTQYDFNWRIILTKQDTTLNNFTVSFSNVDIKGYLHYNAAGLKENVNNENKILYNTEAIFFDEKWLNKKYWITDVAGRELFNGKVNSTTEKINLDNGLYILNTEHGSQKMIISKN